MPVPEWFASANITKHQNGISGAITPSEEFTELFQSIRTELKRVGRSLRWKRGLQPTKVLTYYSTKKPMPADAEFEDMFVPHFKTVKFVAIPDTIYSVDQHGALLYPCSGRAEAELAVCDITNIETKAAMEAVVAGLRSL